MSNVPNIVVLVSGTVDPGNMNPDTRSASYRSPKVAWWLNDPNWYWEENVAFGSVLQSLREQYTNIHLFTAHGWSGDNAAPNRRIVGAYLANRLCGAGGEKAYYEGFLDQEVAFHFIGHSHGGNVINELTRRASELLQRGKPTQLRQRGVWPAQWKIRSITYLSTPFFTRLHQVKTDVFHKDCRIINVFNKYDLTQRSVADFSLSPLHEVLKQAGASEVQEHLKKIHFDSNVLNAWKSTSVDFKDDKTGKWDPKLLMDKAQGRKLYDACIEMLTQVQGLFDKVGGVVRTLNTKGITFPVPIQVDGKMITQRKVMSDKLAKSFQDELTKIKDSLTPTLAAFKGRRKGDVYPLTGFFDDLHTAAFLQALINFLWVDSQQLTGRLWNLVYQLLLEQIDEFDDTSNTPAAQLANTAFANRILHVDVTRQDPYEQFGKGPIFKRFIDHLEKAEARYAKTKSQRDMMDILFTLLAQVEPLRATLAEWQASVQRTRKVMNAVLVAAAVNRMLSKPLVLVWELLAVLGSYGEIFQARNFGQMEVPFPMSTNLFLPSMLQPGASAPKPNDNTRFLGPVASKPAPTPPTYGSLDYFMRVSHSISRQDVYPEVLTGLRGQISCMEHKKPLKKAK
jgi:hypothetical protein